MKNVIIEINNGFFLADQIVSVVVHQNKKSWNLHILFKNQFETISNFESKKDAYAVMEEIKQGIAQQWK